jgi:hypothetical protein
MLAKVWNDGPTDYTEKFNDNDIQIKKGGFVEMDYFDAVGFMGQYIKPTKTDVGGPTNHKQLRLEPVSDAASKPVEHRCQACLGLFATANELILHSESFHKEKAVASTISRTDKAEPNIRTR